MSLRSIQITDFRCFREAAFVADPQYNLVFGANASGKTSLLEAIGFMGRGKSFRGASTAELIRQGAGQFLLLGKVDAGGRESTVGVRNGAGLAGLAERLPLQIIDPDVHNLVAGGPEERRRFLDWIAFHVEPQYLHAWRRFRRVLKQRNAALKQGSGDDQIAGWNTEFINAGMAVHACREQLADILGGVLVEAGDELLGSPIDIRYRPGWSADKSLEIALGDSLARDREIGSTQVGPHRGDLKLGVNEKTAKRVVSRGQQKLLACALILTATDLVQTELERPLLLLLDDPAAELDSGSVERLMHNVFSIGCQVVATALEPDRLMFPEAPAMFHVEQGELRRV